MTVTTKTVMTGVYLNMPLRLVLVDDEEIGTFRPIGMGFKGDGWRVNVEPGNGWRRVEFDVKTLGEIRDRVQDLVTNPPPPARLKAGRKLLADELDSIALDISRIWGRDSQYLRHELHDIAARLRE